ncbi:MAG: PfkB family carbohydrate kinase, partial [Chloroflexota bacterium]
MESDHHSDSDIVDGFVLVIGSAGIDIKAQAHAPIVERSTNHGTVRNNVGGVARNIAENLARLEVDTILLSAVGDDDEGDRVIQVTAGAGVNCDFVQRVDEARTGSYVALMNEDGHPHAAITDYDISDRIDSDYLQQHELLFSTAAIVAIDATLSDEALDTLFELTTRYNLRVCADPTSPTLAERLRTHIDQLYLVVPNAAETVSLCGVAIQPDDDDNHTRGMGVARELVKSGAEIGVVTLGAEGLVYAHSNGSGFIRAAQVEVVDSTGAGDAF